MLQLWCVIRYISIGRVRSNRQMNNYRNQYLFISWKVTLATQAVIDAESSTCWFLFAPTFQEQILTGPNEAVLTYILSFSWANNVDYIYLADQRGPSSGRHHRWTYQQVAEKVFIVFRKQHSVFYIKEGRSWKASISRRRWRQLY